MICAVQAVILVLHLQIDEQRNEEIIRGYLICEACDVRHLGE